MAAPIASLVRSVTAVNVASVNTSVLGIYAPGAAYILLAGIYNENHGAAATTVSSIVSAGMTWTLRRRSNSSATGGLELWWAPGIGNLAGGYTFTINFSGTYDGCSIHVLGVTGCANVSAPFDTNAGLPRALSAPTATWTPSFTGINTSSADDLLLFVTGAVGGNSTAASGFTRIDRISNVGGAWTSILKTDGRAVTALQSGATITHGDALTNPFGSATTGEAIFDALAGTLPAAASARQYAVSIIG